MTPVPICGYLADETTHSFVTRRPHDAPWFKQPKQ
jgi:hypothetical protein